LGAMAPPRKKGMHKKMANRKKKKHDGMLGA
jgi:hypothetical protein